jgi:hypothetical protein
MGIKRVKVAKFQKVDDRITTFATLKSAARPETG